MLKYHHKHFVWFLLYFYGEEKEINIDISDKIEFKSWKWDEASNIENNVPKFRKNVYKKVFSKFLTKINNFIQVS